MDRVKYAWLKRKTVRELQNGIADALEDSRLPGQEASYAQARDLMELLVHTVQAIYLAKARVRNGVRKRYEATVSIGEDSFAWQLYRKDAGG